AQGVLTHILPSIHYIHPPLQIQPHHQSFKSLQKPLHILHQTLLTPLKDNPLQQILPQPNEFHPNLHQPLLQHDNPHFKSRQLTQQ
ncbi:nucleotide exchange factor GrpE, partial [Staphylococcus epidermidis]